MVAKPKESGQLLGLHTSIALSLETRNGHPRLFVWHHEKTGIKPVGEEELINLRIPVRDRRKGGLGRIEVAILAQKRIYRKRGPACGALHTANRRTRPGNVARK